MSQSEYVSIIMPAYNAGKTLSAAVESVLAQTYTNFELLIIDDCSNDTTLNIAKEYAAADSRIKLISNEKNLGASRTRHKGVKEAKGEWLAFLDSDDMWLPDKLEKQFLRQRESGANLLFTASAFVDALGNPVDWMLHVPEEIEYRKLLKQNLISNSSVLIRKELFEKNEVVGENMHEDFACWLNVLRSGEKAYGIDEALLVYRLSSNSKSGNKLKAAKMNWNAYRAAGLNCVEAAYYMLWYTVNGLKKYRNLK